MRQRQLPRNDARTEEAAKALNDSKHSWAADFADASLKQRGRMRNRGQRQHVPARLLAWENREIST